MLFMSRTKRQKKSASNSRTSEATEAFDKCAASIESGVTRYGVTISFLKLPR